MFYDEFVRLCKAKDVSRTKTCMDCGVSRTAWHKWESGATPNGKTLSAIAEYFGVSTDYLLTGEEKKEHAVQTEPDITFDDFTYAMNNASGKLSQEEKDVLLGMAKQFEAARKLREKHEDSK